jgi:hypothetical protein
MNSHSSENTPKNISKKYEKIRKKLVKHFERTALKNMKEKNKIIERLSKYCDKWVLDECHFYIDDNNLKWTIADLFIRQYLNNGCDGFGLKNVRRVYNFLCSNKEILIKHNMVSERAWNNSGYPLWDNYKFQSYWLLNYKKNYKLG